MSRFFTTGLHRESESSLSREELVTKPVSRNYGKQPLLLSEDEEDTKRVVRSAKNKWHYLRKGKKMNKNNAKALSTMRQKIRKHSPDFESHITNYRQNPEQSADEDAEKNEDSEGSSDEDEDSEDSEDDEEWDSQEEEGKQTVLASKFPKKAPTTEEDKKKKHDRKSKCLDEEEEDNEGETWERGRGGVPLVKEKPKVFAKGTEITHIVVIKKLNGILQARGKKGTDRTTQTELPQLLVQIASENNLGEGVIVNIKFNIIASMTTTLTWDVEMCLDCINELMDILVANPNILVGENVLEENENLQNFDQPLRLRGCILTLVERMDEEFTKIMQSADPHSQEYVEHLKDEAQGCATWRRRAPATEKIYQIYLRCILHTYYKFNYKAHQRQLTPPEGQDQAENEGEDSAVLMERLCKHIYAKDLTDWIHTCSILCYIYHYALHSCWYQAWDRMLMSPLQDNIQHVDPPVQILCNCTMVQLGICAFHQGLKKDAHNVLLDIQSSGQAKEVLGQGLLLTQSEGMQPGAEEGGLPPPGALPPAYQPGTARVCLSGDCNALGDPYMAAHESDACRHMISKQFQHQLWVGEWQPLLGPPESMRECVVAASKAMKMGDWKTCHSFIINEKMNGKVWDLFPEADKVHTMLVRKIQEESLRTYLFTYSSVYDSISMETLSDMFELDLPTVHSIISKMIINEELMASLDQLTQIVVMHCTEPTLAEKLGSPVENNEWVFDHKQGTYDQKDGYHKNEGSMCHGGYSQQQSQTAY
uniref:PCI domain-containing protein n=1 Tax=Nannospalax galili TaxID=1026970 RepID=A0A8C6QTN8_NANGA